MKILLAVDGSSYTKKMLAYLVTHDDTFHGDNDYTLLNVQARLPPLPPLPESVRAAVGKEAVDDYHRAEAERVLAPAAKFLMRHGIDARSAWKLGTTGETIAKFAESGKFDLVIMGSHGHGVLVNLVMGSVATQVLARSKVPVLLVR